MMSASSSASTFIDRLHSSQLNGPFDERERVGVCCPSFRPNGGLRHVQLRCRLSNCRVLEPAIAHSHAFRVRSDYSGVLSESPRAQWRHGASTPTAGTPERSITISVSVRGGRALFR